MSFTDAERRALAYADELVDDLVDEGPWINFLGRTPPNDVIRAVMIAQRMGVSSVWCRGLWVRSHSLGGWAWRDATDEVAP